MSESNALNVFGLSINQSRLLFSIEKYLVEKDIELENKNYHKKKEWLAEWEKSILDYLRGVDSNIDTLYGLYEIHRQIAIESEANSNRTWYYLIIFEAVLFNAYSPVDEDVKKYKGLKYKNQIADIKEMVKVDGIIDESFVDDANDSYVKAKKNISGSSKKLLIVIPVVAITVAVATLCSAFAGPIAIMLVGENFAGLYGAALTSASLAMLGGGAIAVGGAGMAGGTAVIVGGGALLGFAASGSVSAAGLALLSSPEYTVLECSKISVAIKEILINRLGDIDKASRVLQEFKSGIQTLEEQLNSLEEKKDRKKLKESISYMKKTAVQCEEYIASSETN